MHSSKTLHCSEDLEWRVLIEYKRSLEEICGISKIQHIPPSIVSIGCSNSTHTTQYRVNGMFEYQSSFGLGEMITCSQMPGIDGSGIDTDRRRRDVQF